MRLVKNPSTYTGSQVYQYVDETYSMALYDTAVVTITGGSVIQTIKLEPEGAYQEDVQAHNIYLYPGDSLAIVAAVSSGAASEVSASINWTRV